MTPSPRAWLPKKEPWAPPDRDDAVIWASLAFSKGLATESQQRLLWDWFMYATGTGDEFADLSFRPGEEGRRATDQVASRAEDGHAVGNFDLNDVRVAGIGVAGAR